MDTFKKNCGNDSFFIGTISVLIPALFFVIMLNLPGQIYNIIDICVSAIYTYTCALAIYVYYYNFKWRQ